MAAPRQRLTRTDRLTDKQDFQAVFRHGKRIERHTLIAIWRDSALTVRAGFAVSRNIRGAVDRNRARRRLKEAYRLGDAPRPAGVEVVFVARPVVLRSAFSEIRRDVDGAIAAIGALRRPAC